jgi:hypothetical protein
MQHVGVSPCRALGSLPIPPIACRICPCVDRAGACWFRATYYLTLTSATRTLVQGSVLHPTEGGAAVILHGGSGCRVCMQPRVHVQRLRGGTPDDGAGLGGFLHCLKNLNVGRVRSDRAAVASTDTAATANIPILRDQQSDPAISSHASAVVVCASFLECFMPAPVLALASMTDHACMRAKSFF